MPGVHSSDHHYSVNVFAPARLHMGFIDLGGSLGRRFGSIGVGINEIATRLSITAANTLQAEGPCHERAVKAALKFAHVQGTECRVAIRIHEAIPEHVGLGSGTQLDLAVGIGLARFLGLDLGVRDIAKTIERGARSGIGIAVFEQGGLVVDGGRGPTTETPPLISRMEIPADWRFILAFDRRGQGLHGKQEVDAFNTLPTFPIEQTQRLSHLLLMQALPALAEGDILDFGNVITELQNAVGDHFAPAQGGRFTSPDVAAAMAWLEAQGAVGIGQTSWGPTGFCLLGTPEQAEALASQARLRFGSVDFLVATARNRGAEILPERLPPAIDGLRAEG
jgi:beta-ribofuranosylaminobenzene 5'-phosphate synthase